MFQTQIPAWVKTIYCCIFAVCLLQKLINIRIWMFPIIVVPQIIYFNRVVHYFHHPFWVFSPYFWKHPYIKIIKFGDLASGKKQPTFCRRLYAPPRGSLESTSWMFLSDLPERFQGHVFKQPLVSSWLGMWIFVCFFCQKPRSPEWIARWICFFRWMIFYWLPVLDHHFGIY